MTALHHDNAAAEGGRHHVGPPHGRREGVAAVVSGSMGYAVRLDRRVDLRSFCIVYMTIEILLRMLMNNKRRAAGDKSREETMDADGVVLPLSMETIYHLIIDKTHE